MLLQIDTLGCQQNEMAWTQRRTKVIKSMMHVLYALWYEKAPVGLK